MSSQNVKKETNLPLLGLLEEEKREPKQAKKVDKIKCKCKNSPILIVDDDVFNIMTLRMMIKSKYKIEPDTAGNG